MKASVLALSLLPFVAAVSATAGNGGDWSDRKEYDIVLTIRSESSPQKRLALLENWKQSYPKTSLSQARDQLYLNTYQVLGDHAHMFDVAKQMLATQPEDPVGLYWLTVLAPQQAGATSEVVDAGDKAAHKLLSSLDSYFTAAKKPISVADSDWQKQKLNVEVLAHRTIGWASWQRGNLGAAEDDLSACLQKDPGNAEVSSWLGIISAVDANKQPKALWHLARATNKEISSPLAEEQRRQVNAMLENMYASYHGSMEGLDQLRKVAVASPFPPPEFSIDPATVVNARRAEADLSLTNPELARWLSMRRQLEAPEGEKYFASDLEGKPLSKLRGTVLRATPPRSPREIILAMSDSATPDVTLKLSVAMPRPVPAGAKISFEGTGESFTKTPFGLTVNADAAELEAKPAKTP